MNDLSEDARDLLARARAVPSLARERQAQVRAALIGQIALAPATGAAAGLLGKFGVAAKLLMAVTAIGIAGTAAVLLARSDDAPARQQVVQVATRTPEAPASAVETAPAAPDPAAAGPSVKAEHRATPSKQAEAPEARLKAVAEAPPAASATADTLREEIALVKKANALLRNGKPEQARVLLDQHKQKFASGALREEREAAQILTLCALGKRREAKAAAAKFLQSSPRSMQAARVRASCAR